MRFHTSALASRTGTAAPAGAPAAHPKAVNGRDITGVPLAEIAATMAPSRGHTIKLFVARSDKDVFKMSALLRQKTMPSVLEVRRKTFI